VLPRESRLPRHACHGKDGRRIAVNPEEHRLRSHIYRGVARMHGAHATRSDPVFLEAHGRKL
jgi:hypothetical protein